MRDIMHIHFPHIGNHYHRSDFEESSFKEPKTDAEIEAFYERQHKSRDRQPKPFRNPEAEDLAFTEDHTVSGLWKCLIYVYADVEYSGGASSGGARTSYVWTSWGRVKLGRMPLAKLVETCFLREELDAASLGQLFVCCVFAEKPGLLVANV